MTRRRVLVLFGGRSAEHEISCISARSVIDALDPVTNEVVAVGITREGRWHLLPAPPALPSASERLLPGGRNRPGAAGDRVGPRS